MRITESKLRRIIRSVIAEGPYDQMSDEFGREYSDPLPDRDDLCYEFITDVLDGLGRKHYTSNFVGTRGMSFEELFAKDIRIQRARSRPVVINYELQKWFEEYLVLKSPHGFRPQDFSAQGLNQVRSCVEECHEKWEDVNHGRADRRKNIHWM